MVRQPIQTPQKLTLSEVSPSNPTMTNYSTQEAMNAISMPTKTPPTPLQNFCTPVIYTLSQENLLQTIKNWKKSSNKGSLDYIIRKGMGKPCARRSQKRSKREISLFVIDYREIRHIPTDRTFTYENIVVD